MKLKLKVKKNKKKRLVVWIHKNKDLDDIIQELFRFFKDKIKISKISKILKYNIVSSENLGIILSLFSTIQDLIPEVVIVCYALLFAPMTYFMKILNRKVKLTLMNFQL